MNKDDLEYKFKFDDADPFMRYFIVEAASMLSKKLKKDLPQIWPEMFVDDKTARWKLKVQLNGEELPVLEFFKLMDSSYEEMITEKAISLIKDKIDEVSHVVDEVLDEAHEKMEGLFNDIVIEKTFEGVKDD